MGLEVNLSLGIERRKIQRMGKNVIIPHCLQIIWGNLVVAKFLLFFKDSVFG